MNGKQSAIFRMMTLAVVMIASAAWALAQTPQDALKALNAAEGIVAEILLRSGSTREQIPQALLAWTGG